MNCPVLNGAAGRRRWLVLSALAAVAASLPAAAAPRPTTDALHDFEASGPVRLAGDQVLSVCATNYNADSHSMLLAVVDATPGANSPGILAAQQTQVAPYASACVYFTAANWQPLAGPQASVVGLGVDNGFVSQGAIRQTGGIGGGGCIVSMQVLDMSGRPVLVAPTRRYQIP
jgi:hypothetical protein